MPDSVASRLRLGDLLSERGFQLELLTGGPDAAQRPVLGAHAVEVEHPTRWLARDWVMLTTGVRLRGRTGAQRALVRELQAERAAALGFGVGLAFRRVPPALLEAARETGLPVFAVPYETAFRDIIRFIDSSVLSSEVDVLRRLSALQRYLVEALRTPEPERTMIERLGRFLDASVVVLGEKGRVQVATGNAPVEDLWAAIRSEPPGLLEVDVGGWHAVATPVASASDDEGRWLVLASRRPAFIAKLIRPAAEATAPLLAAIARLEDVVRDQEQAVKGALLDEALAPVEQRDLPPLAARAAAFGLDFSRSARVAVLRPRAQPLDLAGVATTLVTRLEQAHLPHLVTRRDEAVIALVQGADGGLAPLLEGVAESHPGAVAGVGRAVTAVCDAHHSLRDAELAVDRAALEPRRHLLQFEDFDLGTFVVSEIEPQRLTPKVAELMAAINANPALREALVSYFQHDLDIAATAAALHLHRNSLRYRLGRVEQLLGRSLRQPSTIAALYIAMVAEAGAGEAA